MSDFLSFASAHGLLIEHLEEGRWIRVKTTDKPKKKNGSYKYLGDVAFLQNFGTMEKAVVWKPNGRAEQIDRAAMRRLIAANEEKERLRQAAARADAESMVRRATIAPHPYLEAKGFKDERGLVLDGELLIPMREYANPKQLNSLQRIKEDGTKLFLAGGKAKSSVLFIGPSVARERWHVEGYATGLSVRAALRELHAEAQIVICFSAGNLAHVGRLSAESLVPGYVFADHDKSEAGAKAAKETGLPWVMAPEEGMDANDVHLKQGVWALAKLIRDIRRPAHRPLAAAT